MALQPGRSAPCQAGARAAGTVRSAAREIWSVSVAESSSVRSANDQVCLVDENSQNSSEISFAARLVGWGSSGFLLAWVSSMTSTVWFAFDEMNLRRVATGRV